MKTNHIYNENCLDTMKRMEDTFIDLTITSPPYDDIRDYEGYSFPFEDIVKELFRVTKEGGIVVWVVGDATVNGSETGTSFRQALYFMDCGFRLHDTMIYQKDSISFPETNRYYPIFEYMFVFSKGSPKTTNLIRDRKNLCANGRKHIKGRYRKSDGVLTRHDAQNLLQEYGVRYNIWRIPNGSGKSSKDKVAYQHPAIFPERLAEDHITSWSNKGDLVYDPFMGSGTTAKMSILNGRNFVGSEISKEYCNLIEERLSSLIQYQPKSQSESESESEPLSLLDILLGDQDEN